MVGIENTSDWVLDNDVVSGSKCDVKCSDDEEIELVVSLFGEVVLCVELSSFEVKKSVIFSLEVESLGLTVVEYDGR